MKRLSRSSSKESSDRVTEEMEQLSVVDLSKRKELRRFSYDEQRRQSEILKVDDYPLAVILRIRILQIVCGIFNIVMGSVAVIEERDDFNLSLGIPTGCGTVVAAAASIHTTLTWISGGPKKAFFKGVPSILWIAATSLLLALVIQCCRTIHEPSGFSSLEYTRPHLVRDLVLIASLQLIISIISLTSVAICTKIEYRS